jgi:hypothetical protein
MLMLYVCENGMSSKGVFHFVGTRLECLQQVAVATLEILKNIGQLVRRHLERQDPADDMVRPRLVDEAEVPRFGPRPERAHDYPRRIGAQRACRFRNVACDKAPSARLRGISGISSA